MNTCTNCPIGALHFLSQQELAGKSCGMALQACGMQEMNPAFRYSARPKNA
jgi:hypothetical protein